MQIEENRTSGIQVLTPIGRMDATGAEEFSERFVALVDEGERRFVFDLSRLTYISSMALRAFLQAGKELSPVNGKLTLAGAAGPVKEILELAGFKNLYAMFATRAEALANLAS